MAPERVLLLRFSSFSSRNSSHNLQTKMFPNKYLHLKWFTNEYLHCNQTIDLTNSLFKCKQTAVCNQLKMIVGIGLTHYRQ